MYQTQVETIKGRQIVTVWYDREKDDFLEAVEWVKRTNDGSITIIAKPKRK